MKLAIFFYNLVGKTMVKLLQQALTGEQTEILKAVFYFDVFRYPLTRQELFENSAITISKEKFNSELDQLLQMNLIRSEGEFILNFDKTKLDLQKRLQGNEGAKKIMPKALKYSRLIAGFPFVEAVCLSGGLSKNYYDAYSDIDFFIITSPNRLWICRSLLIIVYKFLPGPLKKFWCTNYFVSSENLSIPDVNAFTSTELAYLIPTVNYQLYKKLVDKNSWYKSRFPNKTEALATTCTPMRKNFLKKSIETLLEVFGGNRLDNLLLGLTLKRWRKKYPELNSGDFELQFRTRKDVCKRHTHGFQNKVLTMWQEKMEEFEQRFQIKLH
ncbi:hypothetical protein CNR22_11035 [Sphingobacteriaceae bacterium]|nr:hypothetical protein CNR22_11035 [Sphingobacteriaceae bacterium]